MSDEWDAAADGGSKDNAKQGVVGWMPGLRGRREMREGDQWLEESGGAAEG